ncbi:MAG: phage major capsid protein [Anaerolineae bacterium]|nr:phage major capsid protein [Anaerolineae bacterium]
MNHDKDMLAKPLERSFTIQERAADEEARTVEIAFSSEEPYERYFGVEVLSHDPHSVRLDRLMGGAAVLVNHDSSDQVGVVESARIDGDKRGRAVIRFSKSQRGQEIFQDVQDGIRQLVSVGYRVHKYEVEEREGQADMVTVTDWEPFELSLVAIPADATVGVGRSADQSETVAKPHVKEAIMPEEVKTEQEVQKPAFDHEAERTKLRTEEKRRTDSIRQAAERFEVEELGREAINEGWSVQQFNEKALEVVGERNNKARSETRHDGEVDLSNKDRQQFSLIKLMDAISNPNDRAAQNRAGFELEVSAEAIRGFGSDFKARGEFVPQSLLSGQRDLSAGTATDGAELVASNLLAGSYIEVLRNASAVTRAGMTILSGLVGNVDIPRQTSAAASTWISAEDGDATESEPQFDQVSLSPKDLACYTEVTRRLLQQSTPSIERIVRMDLAKAQALGIDYAALYGSGSAGQPLGLSGQTGINTKDLAAADPTYAELVAMVALVMADNAIMGTPMWLIEANGWEALSTTPKQGSGVEGNFILGEAGRIVGYNHIVSNQLADEDYFFGDFSQILCGEWGGLEINVDPYTHSLKGKIRYVTFKTVDIAVRQPTAFCWANDAQ